MELVLANTDRPQRSNNGSQSVVSDVAAVHNSGSMAAGIIAFVFVDVVTVAVASIAAFVIADIVMFVVAVLNDEVFVW